MVKRTIFQLILVLAIAGCVPPEEVIPDWDGPNGFVADQISADTVELSWNPATSDNEIAGYILEYTGPGTPESRDVGNVLNYTWTGLPSLGINKFSLIAYDTDGEQSIPITTATVSTDSTPPTDIADLSAAAEWHNSLTQDYVHVNVSFSHSSSLDIDHYEISISSNGGATRDILYDFTNVTGVDIGYPSPSFTVPDDVTPGPVLSSQMLIPPPYFTIGETYTLRIVTVDYSDNRSNGISVQFTPML